MLHVLPNKCPDRLANFRKCHIWQCKLPDISNSQRISTATTFSSSFDSSELSNRYKMIGAERTELYGENSPDIPPKLCPSQPLLTVR
jgi:hypothetical protein